MSNEIIDDVPFADPEIKQTYEAALGKFLLSYNQIEYYIGVVLYLILPNAEPRILEGIIKSNFSSKLSTLELLSHTTEGKRLKKLRFAELSNLNSSRNKYAHGHMDQNPFDGSFEILGKQRLDNASASELEKLAKKAEELWDQLRYIKAAYWFDEINE